MPSTTLALPERETLAALETVIERGITTFVEVGEALAQIRDSHLYRETHQTFADYCRERWGMTDRRARQLMGAASVSVQIGTTVPLSERAVRPLTSLPAEAQQEAATEVRERVEAGEPPARAVAQAVAPRRPAPPPTLPEPEDDSPSPDLVAELEDAAREIDRLNELVTALQKSEEGREIAAWSAKYAQLNARLQQQLTTASEARKEAERHAKLLARIRKALGVEANGEILDAIADLKR